MIMPIKKVKKVLNVIYSYAVKTAKEKEEFAKINDFYKTRNNIIQLLNQIEKCEGFPEKKICKECNNSGSKYIEIMDAYYPCDCNHYENSIFNQAIDLCRVAWVKVKNELDLRLNLLKLEEELTQKLQAELQAVKKDKQALLDDSRNNHKGENHYIEQITALRKRCTKYERKIEDLEEEILKYNDLPCIDLLQEQNTVLHKENKELKEDNERSVNLHYIDTLKKEIEILKDTIGYKIGCLNGSLDANKKLCTRIKGLEELYKRISVSYVNAEDCKKGLQQELQAVKRENEELKVALHKLNWEAQYPDYVGMQDENARLRGLLDEGRITNILYEQLKYLLSRLHGRVFCIDLAKAICQEEK